MSGLEASSQEELPYRIVLWRTGSEVERVLARSLATGWGELSVTNALRTDEEVRMDW